MVAFNGIKNQSISNSFTQIFSPLTYRVHWKALAVIVVVGLLFSTFAYYLIKFRVSSTPPPLATNSTQLPSAPPLTVRDIRKKICLKKIEAMLEPGQKLGEAIDSGDCFYDALSQTLQKIGMSVSQQQLRLDIATALENPDIAQKIQEQIKKDPRGIKSFEDYKKYVCHSKSELDQIRLTDSEAPSAPHWGVEDREGTILCDKYKFNLRVLSVGLLDDEFKSDKTLENYQNVREQFENEGNQALVEHYDDLIQQRLKPLSQDESQYYTDETIYPPDAPYPKTCTLVLYENHFRPVLSS